MIAAVHMGGVGGLMLAAEKGGGLGRYTAKGLSGGVKYIPLAVDLAAFGHISRHSVLPPVLSIEIPRFIAYR